MRAGRGGGRAEKAQAVEAHKKYSEEYEKWEQRQKWAQQLGYKEDLPPNTDEVAEARAKSETKKPKGDGKAKKKKKKKQSPREGEEREL